MVDISILSSQEVSISTPIPSPVIIFSGMGISEWKNFFKEKKCKSNAPIEKIAYNRCFKIIQWAEFCDGTLTKVRNFKTEKGMNIQFYFSFPTLAVRAHFDRNVEKNIEAITDPAQRSRTIV